MKTSDIEVALVDHCGSDLSVVNAARVSFHKESEFLENGKLKLGDEKLIHYLAKHKHTSPFNHAFLTFRVKAPIFVARQLVKHKFMPWNEVSRRYVDEEPEFYVPQPRKRAENVKQGSSDDLVEGVDFSKFYPEMLENYNDLLSYGVAPEVARGVLPQTMMTEWVWSGTLGAYCDMLRLRLDPHAQYESQVVAQKIAEIVKSLFPISYEALLGE